MNLSKKATHTNETKLGLTSKGTALNPNAAEFVPSGLRSSSSSSSSTNTGIVDGKTKFTPTGTSGKSVLDRSESSISKNSDEEAHQYWCHQLPDDITPDFNVMNEDESQHRGSLSLASLSLQDDSETSIFPTLTGSGYLLNEQQDLSKYNGTTSTTNSFVENLRHASSYEEELSSASLLHAKPWERKGLNSNQLLSKGREGAFYGVKSKHVYMNDPGEQSVLDDTGVNPMELLASHFPGFASESLAQVYFANGCDLNLTIEMLIQLELQVEGNFNQSPNSKTLPDHPNLTAMDFPALPSPNGLNGSLKYTENDFHPSANRHPSSEKDNMLMFKSSSFIPSRGPGDFASAVQKLASNDSALWKYENNGSSDAAIGSSRNSHILAGAYTNGNGRSIYSDRLQSSVSSRKASLWLETGDAVANMYSEQREEARDHARLRNAYFDQARQAYLIGNKALAKELSVKGQLHNMQMKAAHGKAQESIYRQRNPVSGTDMMGNGRGSERMIDLHGLHVTEAIHVLKHELSVLRKTARVADQRLQVYICVGTGHHTRGSRTPARLPISVQRYLLEEEGLDFSEPQPGLLRVVIY